VFRIPNSVGTPQAQGGHASPPARTLGSTDPIEKPRPDRRQGGEPRRVATMRPRQSGGSAAACPGHYSYDIPSITRRSARIERSRRGPIPQTMNAQRRPVPVGTNWRCAKTKSSG